MFTDIPVKELIRSADSRLTELRSQGLTAHVHFKATCPKCGERPMFSEPDTVFDQMECSECSYEFPFTEGNYMLIVTTC